MVCQRGGASWCFLKVTSQLRHMSLADWLIRSRGLKQDSVRSTDRKVEVMGRCAYPAYPTYLRVTTHAPTIAG